jgi:hypothetical protein
VFASAQLAINEASALHRVPAKLALERDEYLYRSYTALGQYPMVLAEIKDTANVPICKPWHFVTLDIKYLIY